MPKGVVVARLDLPTRFSHNPEQPTRHPPSSRSRDAMPNSTGTSSGGRVKEASTNLISNGKGRLRVAATAGSRLSSCENVDAHQSLSRRTLAKLAPSPDQPGPPSGSRSPVHEAEQRKPCSHCHRRSHKLTRQPPPVPATRNAMRKGGGTHVTMVATREYILSILQNVMGFPSICVLVAADMATNSARVNHLIL